MNGLELALRLIVGVGLILANAFFVAIEFALTRVRQYPESEFDEPGLRRAWEMTNDLEIHLTGCQIGISATSIALGIIAEPALSAIFEPFFRNTFLPSVGAGAVLAFIIINLVHLTHGEQTPTYLGVERTKFVARYGARPLYWYTKAIYPIIALGDGVAKWTLRRFGVEMTGAWLETESDIIDARGDLRHRMGDLLDQGDIGQERKEEILNAFDIGERPVSDVMTPRKDVTFLSTTVPIEENLRRIGTSPHTRFPLIEDEANAFQGIIYVPSVVDRIDELREGTTRLEDLAASPLTVQAETTISDAVDLFQDKHQELALVLDEQGTVLGLITATNALEAMLGEIEDPLDLDVKNRSPTDHGA